MDVVSPILAKAAAGYVINKLIDAATTYLRDQYYWKTDLQKELQNLRRLLPQIQAVVGFAEHTLTWYEASNPALMEWLRQFRNEIDEVEEVLDELEYRGLEKKFDSDKTRVSTAVKAAKKLWKSRAVLERLRTCVKNLNTSASDVGNFLTLVTQTGGISSGQIQQEIIPLTNESRITSSLPALSFKGREEEKAKIIHYLLGDSAGESEIQRSQNVHCLPLVAMGGMGKTALAQQVFDHFENVKKEHFHIKIWICVSTYFNASILMKKILKYLTDGSESVLLEQLPVKLKGELHSKRFLLVLDDAWDDENLTEWEKLCAPLRNGQKGSWILLTTRSSSVAKMVSKVMRSTMEPMKLPGLSKDECRSLFYEHAFAGRDPNEFPLLKKIGEEIVKKLNGIPLLAKSIGGALNSKLDDPDRWASISRSEVWKTPRDSRDKFIPALTLSYVMLQPHLKRCFSYCGIFPEDYEFNKQMLVGMWIAAGLIYSDESAGDSEEDIGNCCFDMLYNKSFFDVHTRNWNWSSDFYDTAEDIYYTMHDMLNGLARHVSRYECCRIVHDAPSSILDDNAIRHISISITRDAQLHDVAKMVSKFKHLRTFWITYYGHPQKLYDFIRDACKSPRKIRVLIIKSDHQWLESIGDFVKVRFLDISAHPRLLLLSLSLSKSICKFYFLQVLIGNHRSPILTKDANKLTNLRHLYKVKQDALLEVAEVGKLSSLQKLCFTVGTDPGYKIDELMNMNNLHQLKIKRLSNVRNLEEVNKVNLVRKRNLMRLELHYWDEVSSNPDLDQQEVLAALRPPPTIRELFITDYKGGRPAPWMNTSSLSCLESLELCDCTYLEEVPPLWKLPCLKFLKLNGLKAIKILGCHSDQMDIQFPILEKLEFNNLPLWEEWISADDYIWFPHLKSFEIYKCPKLKKIPDLPMSIENLKIVNSRLKALPRSYKCSNDSRTFGGFQQLISLESLEIFDCPIIGEEDEIFLPSSLKELKLEKLTSLQKLCFSVGTESDYKGSRPAPWINTSSLSWLESVELYDCTSLEELPPLWKLPCLKFLKLCWMEAIKSLGCHSSDQMGIQFPVLEKLEFHHLFLLEEWNGADDYIWFPHLKSFEINYCPRLKKIPDLPLSIENFKIVNSRLKALPQSYKCFNGSGIFGGFQQLTSLESLEINDYLIIGEDNDNLLPSSLKNLKLRGFFGRPNFLSVELESRELFDNSASNKVALPSSLVSLKLQESDISQESLGRRLQGLTSLKGLQVSNCDNLVFLRNLTGLRPLKSLTALVTLRKLEITGCPKLLATTFSTLQNPATTTEESATKIKKGTLPSLEVIVIDSIFYLPNLPMSERLKTLYIQNKIGSHLVPVAEFTCFPSEIEESLLQYQESLKHLTLGGMPHLQSLPASLGSFSSLKTLEIFSAWELKSLPRMPASLKRLRIEGCSAELKQRCQNNIGLDWPNINNIPDIRIRAEVHLQSRRERALASFC